MASGQLGIVTVGIILMVICTVMLYGVYLRTGTAAAGTVCAELLHDEPRSQVYNLP